MTLQIAELPQKGVLVVRGPDAKTFLQGQLTCDMNLVSPERSSLGAQCNLQGRVHSLFRIIQQAEENSYALLMPKSLVPIAQAGLKKYALFSKVTIEPLEGCLVLGISGDKVSTIIDSIVHNSAFTIYAIQSNHSYEILASIELIHSLKQRLLSDPELNIPGELQVTPFEEVTYRQWERLELEAGLPEVYPETVDAFLPHHIGLVELGGVSFDKGCYLGQEIVARMQWRGNIKRHLVKGVLTQTAESPKAGELLYGTAEQVDEPVGQIVRVSFLEDEKYHVLAVLKDNTTAYLQGTLLNSATS